MTAIFGVGGGFLITPLLHVILGVPMPTAVGTSSVQILGVSAGSLYERRRSAPPALKIALVMLGGNYAGVQLGARLLGYLESLGQLTLNNRPVSAADLGVLLIYVPLLVGIAVLMRREAHRAPEQADITTGYLAKIRIPPYSDFGTHAPNRLSIPAVTLLGLAIGFLTGLLGIGGGVILFPALVYLVGLPTRQASSTSLVIVLFTAIIAVVTHTLADHVNLILVIPLLVGGSLGTRLGVDILAKMNAAQIRQGFVYVLILAILIVLYQLVTVLFI
ncbi:MAG: sulfite exporter TauE/SafE family protein [Chloroflexi bacterium]|nr:sulfite exporter TauE/SafE family protein [Chloroflexota bacterium]